MRRTSFRGFRVRGVKIKLNTLRLDFQDSDCLIEEVVQEKLSVIEAGETLQPIIVRFDGESYFLQDGFHRVEAARRSGLLELDAEILPGTLEDMESEFRAMLDVLKGELHR
jgi:ParB-like chromosome segregation protein Spo0J